MGRRAVGAGHLGRWRDLAVVAVPGGVAGGDRSAAAGRGAGAGRVGDRVLHHLPDRAVGAAPGHRVRGGRPAVAGLASMGALARQTSVRAVHRAVAIVLVAWAATSVGTVRTTNDPDHLAARWRTGRGPATTWPIRSRPARRSSPTHPRPERRGLPPPGPVPRSLFDPACLRPGEDGDRGLQGDRRRQRDRSRGPPTSRPTPCRCGARSRPMPCGSASRPVPSAETTVTRRLTS